jgi:anthranilate synthase component 1
MWLYRYVGFDCIHAFEPKTARGLDDQLGLPDSVFMFCTDVVIFDHLTHLVKACVYIGTKRCHVYACH